MKAHHIGLLVAVLAACGAAQTTATTERCAGSPEACPGGAANTGTTTTTAAGVQTTQKGTSSTTAAKGGALPAARAERNEDGTGRVASPPRGPVIEPGNVNVPRTPKPINTGDPCGPCD